MGSDEKKQENQAVPDSKKLMLPVRMAPGNMKIVRVPILRPKMKVVAKKKPSPLIAELDKEKTEEKKPYFTEIEELRKEFGIPDSFDSKKPTTMCELALIEKLRAIQRLRGENNFLADNISKNKRLISIRETGIEDFKRSRINIQSQCQILESSIQSLESEGKFHNNC
ncbi:unnamed protein product [Caenorhabditis angaria]|uniref:Uncharacterized protein n=1 Tax=Caenorhabditis angaria TaxID=860376 RepID=A0A9P1I5S4_9PELO|nr:unnamed protein product [Caenorhabditis angaria]